MANSKNWFAGVSDAMWLYCNGSWLLKGISRHSIDFSQNISLSTKRVKFWCPCMPCKLEITDVTGRSSYICHLDISELIYDSESWFYPQRINIPSRGRLPTVGPEAGILCKKEKDMDSQYQVWKYVIAKPEGSPGPRLNINTVLSRYGDSYVKDKMAVRTSYL